MPFVKNFYVIFLIGISIVYPAGQYKGRAPWPARKVLY